LGLGLDGDDEAEVLELLDIAVGGALDVEFVQIVLAEIAVGRAVGQDMIDADQQLVGEGQGRLAATDAAFELVVIALK